MRIIEVNHPPKRASDGKSVHQTQTRVLNRAKREHQRGLKND
ncbi:MAG: hypothetical protein QM402_07170 [Synergistota bacterium]|nr:hypothetical protein [Synergistota bacterium]